MQYKNVVFEKIRLQNFLSYGNDPIEVEFKNGITFVTGYNKDEDDTNGVGKTSLIVESLSFLIFGETYRDINQKLIRNKRTTGSCIVEGWLTVNDQKYHITRSLAPNKLILEINGEWEQYTKSIPETTKTIIASIGISKTVFTNTVVMTNKDSLSFLNQEKSLKTKFIEGVLGLEAFSEFFKKAKDEYKALDDEREKVQFQVSQLEITLKSDNQYFEQAESKNKRDLIDLENKIQSLRDVQPVDNSNAIDNLQKSKEEKEVSVLGKEGKIRLANSKKYEWKYDLEQEIKMLKSLEDVKAECPLCKRAYEEHDGEKLETEKSTINKKITDLKLNIHKLDNIITKVQNETQIIKNDIISISNNITNLQKEQRALDDSQREIQRFIDQKQTIQDFENPFKDKVAQTQEQLDNKRYILTRWNNDVRLAGIIKQMASPTGVKALMVKKVIDSFNERINQYMIRLNSPYRVYFDEYFEETITHKDGEAFSYGSLSGGEAKRVDFSMLFAFRDIRRIQSNVSINLTVMDELFDSALSEKGMFNIIELLKEMTEECFFVVTHRSNNVDESGCDVIHLIKENGITRKDNNEHQ